MSLNVEVFKKMTEIASLNLASDVTGFEKAYNTAVAIEQLRELLTPQYMAPIMKLQGSRLGFRTDLDLNKDRTKGPGYPMEIVKECLIEAVLLGVQPVGNQFNIIASGCYLTKEGFGYLLRNMPGLTSWKTTAGLPRIKDTSGAVTVTVEYTYNGTKAAPTILDIPVKVNAYMGVDAVLGKAERKARAWLHRTVTGSESPEGDVLDTESRVMSSVLKEEPIQHADLAAQFQATKHLLSAEEIANGERIIANNEANSYAKLKTLLDGKTAPTMPGA
jgi:hypothetical protein